MVLELLVLLLWRTGRLASQVLELLVELVLLGLSLLLLLLPLLVCPALQAQGLGVPPPLPQPPRAADIDDCHWQC
jgi:hypothetical protein